MYFMFETKHTRNVVKTEANGQGLNKNLQALPFLIKLSSQSVRKLSTHHRYNLYILHFDDLIMGNYMVLLPEWNLRQLFWHFLLTPPDVEDKGRNSGCWRGSSSVCNFSNLCIVIFHVTITQLILVMMPQLILIQQICFVPLSTHYFCDISGFLHQTWSIILCVLRILHFKICELSRAGHLQLCHSCPLSTLLWNGDRNLGQISVFSPSEIQLARLLLYFVVLFDT